MLNQTIMSSALIAFPIILNMKKKKTMYGQEISFFRGREYAMEYGGATTDASQ